ncbi:MAG: YHYH protein [Flavobacterium sp.]
MTKLNYLYTFLLISNSLVLGQTNPIITSWLQNTTGITGRHYLNGNPTPIIDAALANIQTVQYSPNWVYVTTQGVPSFITGPFFANPNTVITATNAIYKFPLNPTQNLGTPIFTGAGNIGIFKNGVGLFSYGDGFSYNPATNSDAPTGGAIWRRDAVKAEIIGFDCSKAHPAAQGNYHHHQNPSAFNFDLIQLSTICNLYSSDGLYTINPSEHSPLLGFAYDGFPIYGAYAYTNGIDDSNGVSRMKSSYQLRNITARTHYADGTDVVDGPAINTNFPLGWYREDYEYIVHSNDPTYLDEHNGRFCKTPEYPNGIYCYFTTVDENYNSTYPYAVGPTYYGVKSAVKVTLITENTVSYTTLNTNDFINKDFKVIIAPNPSQDFIAIQTQTTENDLNVELIDELGKVVKTTKILQGSTLSIVETDNIYNGIYFIRISSKNEVKSYKIIIKK